MTLLYFALQSYFFYPVSFLNLDYVAELSVFLFVILLHIDKATEKKRNICNFNKFCVFLCNDRKNKNSTHVSVQLQVHKPYNKNISD